jgi:Uma2 family endonuclease
MSRIHSQADQLIPPHLVGLHSVTHEQFEELCRDYPDLRLELTSSGELIVMPPTGYQGSARCFGLVAQFGVWVKKDGTGVGFGPSAGWTLPNGAIRGPDVSWITRERADTLNEQEKQGFAHICPDFVVELRSRSDRLPTLLNKMEEYMANGALLGWLIDPQKRRVYIYEAGKEMVVLENPAVVSGEPLLHGFELQMEEIWTV